MSPTLVTPNTRKNDTDTIEKSPSIAELSKIIRSSRDLVDKALIKKQHEQQEYYKQIISKLAKLQEKKEKIDELLQEAKNVLKDINFKLGLNTIYYVGLDKKSEKIKTTILVLENQKREIESQISIIHNSRDIKIIAETFEEQEFLKLTPQIDQLVIEIKKSASWRKKLWEKQLGIVYWVLDQVRKIIIQAEKDASKKSKIYWDLEEILKNINDLEPKDFLQKKENSLAPENLLQRFEYIKKQIGILELTSIIILILTISKYKNIFVQYLESYQKFEELKQIPKDKSYLNSTLNEYAWIFEKTKNSQRIIEKLGYVSDLPFKLSYYLEKKMRESANIKKIKEGKVIWKYDDWTEAVQDVENYFLYNTWQDFSEISSEMTGWEVFAVWENFSPEQSNVWEDFLLSKEDISGIFDLFYPIQGMLLNNKVDKMV